MAITITPDPLDFGGHLIENNASLTVTVTGTGQDVDAEVQASIIALNGPGTFTVTPSSGTASTVGLRLTIVFRASAVGHVTAKLHLRRGGHMTEAVLKGDGVEADDYERRGGSHLLIAVPDYGDTTYVNVANAVDDGIDPTGLDGNTLNSYLRLGTFDYTRESAAAKQLLQMIPKGGAARDPRSPTASSRILVEDTAKGIPEIAGTVFVDDVRIRPGDRGARDVEENAKNGTSLKVSTLTEDDDPDHMLSMLKRQQESAKLYSRGGWRDHSDGNRISTTWGDKVEVVRGNYKMIVLGRQNDPSKAIGWEASGGHIQDHAPGTMPGASFWLEWIDDARFWAPDEKHGGDGRKGAWLLVNTTENVYQFARTAGNLRTENWGDVHETYIGSSNPPSKKIYSEATPPEDKDGNYEGHPGDEGTRGHKVDDDIKVSGLNYLGITPPDEEDQAGKIRNNPHIIGKTWAVRIDTHTGSSDWAIPKIVEKKFVKDSWACTGSSGTRVDDSYSETFAKRTEELVDVEERIISNTRAGNIVEATTAGTITGATTAANIAELTTAGIHTEVHVGGAHLEMEVGIFHGELEIGLKGAIQIAGGYEVTIGSLAEFRFDRTTMRLVNKDTDLEKVTIALNDYKAALFDSNTTLARKETTLSAMLTALTIQLGI